MSPFLFFRSFLVRRWPPGGPARWRDAGMSTAEYAIGTLAAAAFAAVLYQVVTSGTVTGLLEDLVERALSEGP